MADTAYTYGWDAVNECWRKVLVNDEGKLIIDPSEIFENDPTDDEHGKAPDSDWAFDHEADAAAHHAKYTDAESRAAIDNLLDEDGELLKDLRCNSYGLLYLKQFVFRNASGDTENVTFRTDGGNRNIRVEARVVGGAYYNVKWLIYNGVVYAEVIRTDNLLDHYSELKGTQYLSLPGTAFLGQQSFSDNIDYDVSSGKVSLNVDDCVLMAPVSLPEGATVKGVIVYGNAAAEAETFELRRVKLLDATNSQMATQSINTEDITISDPIIDNANYAYFIVTSSLDIGDEIYGALIVYEL